MLVEKNEIKDAKAYLENARSTLKNTKYIIMTKLTPQKHSMIKSVQQVLSLARETLLQEESMLAEIIKDIEDFEKGGIPTGPTGNPKGSKNSQGKLKMKTKLIHKIEPFPGVTSLLRDFIVIPDLRPTVNVRVQELKNLEKYLQSGDLTSAVKSYEFLKTFGGEKDVQDLLAKNGYKVEEKDGKYVISKIAEESSTTTTNTDTSSVNNNENDVVAEETVNPETDQNSPEATVGNQENNQNNTETVVNPTNASNSNYSSSNNNNQHVVENTSTEVNNSDTTSQVETDATTIDQTIDIEDSIKENTKDTTSTNVVSITDDTETTTAKKSSGLGAAIPIGLGTIATGAAAVAGVRYVKNRHDNQEEYDESYDDENNNLDNNDEYIDSAQYDNGSSYMDDDYLGPTDNNISSEDSYVDPSDLEEIEDFSDDSVLEDLNSNF